jgi:3-oxoacyl-[acyl-carrier protein] reductase
MKRTAIVTGAAKGIGRSIVLKCLAQDWAVIGCDKNEEGLQELQKTCPRDLKIKTLDVTNPHDIKAFFEGFDESQVPYALVNNAGIFLGHRLEEYSVESINKLLDTNLKGPIFCTQAFGKLLVAQKKQGVIVNIASVAGQAGSADAIYGASKAGVAGFTKTSAMALAPYIRVNAVAPGIVETDMQAQVSPERRQVFKNAELIKETIQPEDIAESVWFLLSDSSKHYTGAVLDINNGFYFR